MSCQLLILICFQKNVKNGLLSYLKMLNIIITKHNNKTIHNKQNKMLVIDDSKLHARVNTTQLGF